MKVKRLSELSLRTQLILVTTILVILTTVPLSAITYYRQKAILLRNIDKLLMVSAELARAIPPEGYFDRIVDDTSVSPAEYSSIVDRQNKLCLHLDLQYLWSCMLLNGQIVFTTATSPSKDVARQDHAPFLQIHTDPHAFDTVFKTMQPDFSSFENEWGHGRMVLLPFTNARGNPYCVGASISIDDIQLLLGHTLHNSIAIGLITLGLGLILILTVSSSLTKPIVNLTVVADRIRQGSLEHDFKDEGCKEVQSLANSLASMRHSIEGTISALELEVAERRRVQGELQRHRDQLEEIVHLRTAQLERSNRELEQFAYIASHDLNEPLRKITAFGDLLMARYGSDLPAEGADYVQRMCDATTRMQGLIDDLLQLSRVSTRGKPFEEVDLNETMRIVLSDLAPRIAETEGSVDVGPLPTLEADATQMHQLLLNLVLNGLKFRKPDTAPAITVSAGTPAEVPDAPIFSGRSPDELCEIYVQDNGIGFDEEQAERIFHIFQRLHSRSEYEGTGIGLAVCRRIAERHHGTITAHSRPGEGARFVVTLPLKRVEGDPHPPDEIRPTSKSSATL
jgi:signal transduction histidine kinase